MISAFVLIYIIPLFFRYNHKMLLFSAIFLISSLGFTHQFGSVGFILANCLNMGARIIHR